MGPTSGAGRVGTVHARVALTQPSCVVPPSTETRSEVSLVFQKRRGETPPSSPLEVGHSTSARELSRSFPTDAWSYRESRLQNDRSPVDRKTPVEHRCDDRLLHLRISPPNPSFDFIQSRLVSQRRTGKKTGTGEGSETGPRLLYPPVCAQRTGLDYMSFNL